MQSEVEATMRTMPVVELTQAETFVDTGAAIAGAIHRDRDTSPAKDLRVDMSDLRGEFLGKSPCK
jgi:hypothetical protein